MNNDDYDGKKAEEINKLEQTILTQLKVCGSETDKESNGFFSTFELCICIFLFINGLEGIINNLFLLQLQLKQNLLYNCGV